MSLTLTQYLQEVQSWSRDPLVTVEEYLVRAKKEDTYNAFVRLHDTYVAANKDIFSSRPLAAAPIALKDIFMTKGYETTCCSKILQGYIPPYSATCFEKLETAGALMLGKTNMDEFAMGASNETSCFWPVKNPHDPTRISGGSSGGSAAAVAADLCLAALWTDTGGSIRQPAAMCGIVGTKATYGRVSRYGVQAMASSLDHVWVLTKTVEDAVLLMSMLSWEDPKDATSIPFTVQEAKDRKEALLRKDLHNRKIAVPKQFFDEWLEEDVKQVCLQTIEELERQGAIVERIDLPIVSFGVPVYYILTSAEVSTNMAKFDGLRFGLQDETVDKDSIYAYYASIRSEGFGEEVKRRILIGSYVLSAWFYDAYYRKALAVRAQMKREFAKLFGSYDAIVWPTSPEVARKIGEKIDDPVKMYLADIYTVLANIVWNPAISVPIWFIKKEGKQLPVGFQVMTKQRDEATMFGIGNKVMEISHK